MKNFCTKMEPIQEEHLVANRYNRQELVKGWNQNKLRKASVAIIGSGSLANFTSASLVSLGFGNVELYANELISKEINGEFLLNLISSKGSKVESLEKILSKINPLVKVKGIHTKIYVSPLAELVGKPNLIIDTTNSPKSKEIILEYAKKKKIPVISASTDLIKGHIYLGLPKDENIESGLLKDYENKIQGVVPSEVLGGIITEEARKIVMPFNDKDIPMKNFVYSSASLKRFSDENEIEVKENSLKDKRVLMVGAGALGNFVGIGLALANIGEIYILDFDHVETTNLNRQLLFYDSIGKKKSKALASKLKIINPKIKVEGLVKKLDEKFGNYFRFKETRPDLILDCVDNFSTRALINYFAIKYGTPLISGGTSPSSGQVVVYNPGKSACLNCKLNIDKILAKEKTSHSCIYAAQPSVIMTNEVIGGFMVAESRMVLDPNSYGPAIKKMLKYDSINPIRAGLIGGEKPCKCERGPIKQWLKEVITKYKTE